LIVIGYAPAAFIVAGLVTLCELGVLNQATILQQMLWFFALLLFLTPVHVGLS